MNTYSSPELTLIGTAAKLVLGVTSELGCRKYNDTEGSDMAELW